jgi:SAM-dependent methyltransferase
MFKITLAINLRSKLRKLYHRLRTLKYLTKDRTFIFTDIYRHNYWRNVESHSGDGSSAEQTAVIRAHLPDLLREFRIQSMLDAPCGDLNWISLTPLDLDTYIGADIVPDIVAQNQQKYGQDRQFLLLDIIEDALPPVDLIFCRDCLVHFSLADIFAALTNFQRSGATYLLTTTYPNLLTTNPDIITGGWRPIDLQLHPFQLPPPLHILREETTEKGDYPQKSLGLWKLSDLTLQPLYETLA